MIWYGYDSCIQEERNYQHKSSSSRTYVDTDQVQSYLKSTQ